MFDFNGSHLVPYLHCALNDSSIGDTGASQLGEVLSSNQSIETLSLGWSDIGDEGVCAL